MKLTKETVVPYVDLKDIFETLKDEGIKIAINTSDNRKNTEKRRRSVMPNPQISRYRRGPESEMWRCFFSKRRWKFS